MPDFSLWGKQSGFPKLHLFSDFCPIWNVSFQQHFSSKLSWCVGRIFFLRKKNYMVPKGLPSQFMQILCYYYFPKSYEKSETGEWGPNEKFLSIKICKKNSRHIIWPTKTLCILADIKEIEKRRNHAILSLNLGLNYILD